MAEIINDLARLVKLTRGPGCELFAPVRGRGLIRTPLGHAAAAEASEALRTRALLIPLGRDDAFREMGLLIEERLRPRKVFFCAPLDAPESAGIVFPTGSDAIAAFRQKGHLKIGNALAHSHVRALCAYTTSMVDEGWLKRGDGMADRYIAHNLKVGSAYQKLLLPLVAWVADRSIVPSFTYLASYASRAQLPRHRDRAQCDYTLSLDLGHSLGEEEDWPLHVCDAGQEKRRERYVCAPGDAVLFRGCQSAHWREPRVGAGLHNVLMLHYVGVDFSGPLE